MPKTNANQPRANGEIHIAVLGATVAISVEIFTFLFALIWALGQMMFDLPVSAAKFEAIGVALATLVIAVFMARMFYRHECQDTREEPA